MNRLQHAPLHWTCKTCLAGLLLGLALGFGCESQPPDATEDAAVKNDPRSPRIKKRDALFPQETSQKTIPNSGRRP
jgi:hypothetical protein